VACVQNAYNLTSRSEQPLFDACRDDGVPFVPFFPLGSASSPRIPSSGPAVQEAALRLRATPAQVPWPGCWPRPERPAHPGTSSTAHLEENLGAADLVLDEVAVATLAGIETA